MSYITDVERMKAYYLGLSKAGSNNLPKDFCADMEADLADPETEDYYREAMSFWYRTYIPFYNTLAYINNNRLLHNNLSEYLAQIEEHAPTLSPAEIYTRLKTLMPFAVEELVRTIGCGSAVLEELLHAINDNSQEVFVRLLQTNDCDLRAVSHLCNNIWNDIHPILQMEEDETVLLMDAESTRSRTELAEDEELLQAMDKMYQSMNRLEEDDSDENFHQYIDDFYEYIRLHFVYLVVFYLNSADSFLPKEKKIIEQLLTQPEADHYYQVCKDMKAEVDAEPAEQPSAEPFSLPSDMLTSRLDPDGVDEHFDCHQELIRQGVEKLVQLVDYLAEQDYIENTVQAKNLFVYRLTGRNRPPELAPLEWHGKNNRSYELIYLVKHLTAKSDYKKMRQFFKGLQWVKNQDSSYARSACYDFKYFLHQLYPTLPDQL